MGRGMALFLQSELGAGGSGFRSPRLGRADLLRAGLMRAGHWPVQSIGSSPLCTYSLSRGLGIVPAHRAESLDVRCRKEVARMGLKSRVRLQGRGALSPWSPDRTRTLPQRRSQRLTRRGILQAGACAQNEETHA